VPRWRAHIGACCAQVEAQILRELAPESAGSAPNKAIGAWRGPCSASGVYLYPDAPRNVYWETTIACSLACQHCRAAAIAEADPSELTTDEALRLIDSVHALGSLLVLTGGDPLVRRDLFELVEYARSLHVPVAVTPSATPNLTRAALERLKGLGIAVMGLSLDGPNAELHDSFRGVRGTFGHSLRALDIARDLGLPVQVNTTVTRWTRPHLEATFEFLSRAYRPPVSRWSLFVLVPTGRGRSLSALDASELEQLFGWIYEISPSAPFHVSLVEAPHYRRYWLERKLDEGQPMDSLMKAGPRMGFGMRDGNGVIFVARDGSVYPAGFLPYPCLGNVRSTPLEVLYRTAPALLELRDPDRFSGKCGRCRYRALCGGSRARAWAVSLDTLGDDPACAYEPADEREPAWPAPTTAGA